MLKPIVKPPAKRGRPCLYGKPMSNARRQRRYRIGKTGR